MARAVLRDIVFGLATTGLLMGCVEGAGKAGSGDAAGLASAPSKKKSGNQDVEAPEVFEATDSALWDGRPSLGGIWVASAEVTNPERAVMFNPATGKSVTGALFKRERDNPGPRLQLSSDAAEALGILAGQPTEIRVTALRKEETAKEAPAEDTAAADAAPATDPAAKPAADGDAAAIASAALEAVDGGKTKTDAAGKDADPAAAAVEGTAAVAAAGTEGAATAVDATPKKKTWKERRAEAKAAREAKKRAAADAKAAAAAAAAGTVVVEGEAPTTTPDAAAAAMAPIESAPLDARKPDVAKASDKATAKPKAKTVGDAPVVKPAVAAETEVAAPVASGAARPIQVASFSKEDNAKRAAEALAKIGITATPQKSEKAGKAVWGVVVMGDDALLKKIKDAGFADAYFLK
jgi:rare lipoprotein A